jgi:hypothetical protein
MIFTVKEVFTIRYEYSTSEPEDAVKASLIKNQGIIPQINQGTKGNPSLVIPIFNPYVNANHITTIVIPGWINAQGKPRYEPMYLFWKSRLTSCPIKYFF